MTRVITVLAREITGGIEETVLKVLEVKDKRVSVSLMSHR